MTHTRRVVEPWPAAFTAPYLARRIGCSRFVVGGLLKRLAGLPLRKVGRVRVIYLVDLKRADPDLWESIELRFFLSPDAGEEPEQP